MTDIVSNTDFFRSLPEEQKTKELCINYFSLGVNMKEFPKQFQTEEFALECLKYSTNMYLPNGVLYLVPEELRSDNVINFALDLNVDNIKYIPYERQTEKMVNNISSQCQYNHELIKYCNPVFITGKDIKENCFNNQIVNYGDFDSDLVVNEYAEKYDELLAMYRKLIQKLV